MAITRLEWDSSFFKKEVGKLVVGKDDDLTSNDFAKFELIYFFVPPTNIKVNEEIVKLGGLLVDEKITYHKIVKPSSNNIDKNIISYNSSALDDEVIRIGVQSGLFSRFRIDKHFKENEFEMLYTLWMNESIRKKNAKEVFVYMLDFSVGGVVTVGEKNGRADIGIIAVDEGARGQNIGNRLVAKVESFCISNLYSELQVVTQKANILACKFYERCGFSVETVINVYHWWR